MYVKNLTQFLTEALNKAEWLNYKEDTMLNSTEPDPSIDQTADLILKLLNVDDSAKLLFTGEDVSIGSDYRYFMEKVKVKAEQVESGSVVHSDYTEYYTLYKYEDKFFVQLDIKDMYEFSYVFIRQEDYEFFDKIDAPLVPQPKKEEAQPAPGPAAQHAQNQTPQETNSGGLV